MKIGKNNNKDFISDRIVDDYYICYVCRSDHYRDIQTGVSIVPLLSYEPVGLSCWMYWFLIAKKDILIHKNFLRYYASFNNGLKCHIDLSLDPKGKNVLKVTDMQDILHTMTPDNANRYLVRHTLQIDPW